MRITDEMVSRFLTWPVPAEVYPDGTPGQPGRTGTNLMNFPQARAMLEHVLSVGTLPLGYEDEMWKAAHNESNRDWQDWVRGARWATKRLMPTPPVVTPTVPGKIEFPALPKEQP